MAEQKNDFKSLKGNISIDDNCVGQDFNIDRKNYKEQYAKRYEQDTKHRHALVVWMMVVVSLWLLVVIVFVGINNCCLDISDNVLITLLATTTINVLGLANIILKGMFSNSRSFRKNK